MRSPVRVGFDVSPLLTEHAFPPGMVRLVGELTDALERRGELEVVRLSPPRGAKLRSWRARELPRAVAEHDLVGLHSFTSAFPWRGPGFRVQTVHELPWLHDVAENADLAHRAWAALGPIVADRVLCGTEHTARDLRRRWLPGANRIVVCPWGVGAPFAVEPPPGEVDEIVLGEYRLLEDPIVLALGAVRPKKNLDALLAGASVLARRGSARLQIVVTGRETPDLRRSLGLASKLGLSSAVSTLETVEEQHLPALLRLATAVSVLSKSEGFGFPVLEALGCGTPVLVPRASAQSEVADGHGIEVDATDPESVADGLARALAEREELRYVLPERARELSWDRCAEQVEGLWRELAP